LSLKSLPSFDSPSAREGRPDEPFPQLDDDFIAHVRWPADITRRRNVDVVRDAPIIGNDIEELAAALQGADDLGSPAFEYADNRSGILSIISRSQTFGFDISPYQDAVFVQGSGRRILRNGDLFEPRIVRLEKPFSLPVDPNPSRDQIGLPWYDIAIPLNAGDLAGLLQLAQDALEFLLLAGAQSEQPKQLGYMHREMQPLPTGFITLAARLNFKQNVCYS